MKSLLLFCCVVLTTAAFSQTYYLEDFDGVPGPTAGGPGTYTFPSGLLLRNVDNLTPNASVNYVNEAWERREDFANNVADSCAFSTSWYTPAGTSNDFMWTPALTVLPNTTLFWNAVTYDAAYPDGYEVRIMTVPPTGGNGVIGNQITNSTVLFSIGAENTTWTNRNASLTAYTGQTVYIGFRNNSTDQFLLLIDDIELRQITNNDIAVSNVSTTEYTVAPASQLTTVSNINLRGTVANTGLLACTNVALGCQVFVNGVLNTTVQSTTTASLAAGANEIKTIPFAATVDGTYTFKFFPVLTETDLNTANDTLNALNSLVVDPTVMRRDLGNVIGGLGIGAGNGGFLGQTFNFETPVNIESISAGVSRGYTGRNLYAVIYNTDMAGVPTTFLAGTDTLTYPDDSARLYTMPISGGTITLPAGRYAFLQVEPNADSTLQLAQTAAIFTPNTVFVNWPTNPNGNVFTPVEAFGANFARTLVIYPDFDQCFGETGGGLNLVTNATCGQNDGSIDYSLDAGYSITWEDNSTNNVLSNIGTGYYSYTVTNGTCSFNDSIFVSTTTSPTATSAAVNALCNGFNGSISLDVQSGTAPYSYAWSNGVTNDTLFATAGTYSVVITDAAGCVVNVNNLTITEPTAISSTGSSTDATCILCTDGTATVAVSGGTAPYTYMWSNGGVTGTISNLAAGTYNCTITDANGCTETQTVAVGAVNGINEAALNGVSVYPNPAVDFITIQSANGFISEAIVIDAAGKQVATSSTESSTITFNTQGFAKGIYTVILTINGQDFHTQFTK